MGFKSSGSLMKVHNKTRKRYQWIFRGVYIAQLYGMTNKEKLVQSYQ